jgi:predicted O-methyltransferase YrrM
MQLYRSKVLENFSSFSVAPTSSKNMREMVDTFLIWKTIEYFQPAKLLEIGFFAGQTLGIMYESAGPNAKLTSVDINYSKRHIFQKIFPQAQIEYHEISSINLKIDENFDFFNIDGNHDYKHAENDINFALTHCLPHSIIYVDDYHFSGVNQAIKESLLGQNQFVPFLCGDMGMFFHHVGHSADNFLDQWLQHRANNFIYFHNIDYNGFTVLEAKLPNFFVDNKKMFIEACKFYDL